MYPSSKFSSKPMRITFDSYAEIDTSSHCSDVEFHSNAVSTTTPHLSPHADAAASPGTKLRSEYVNIETPIITGMRRITLRAINSCNFISNTHNQSKKSTKSHLGHDKHNGVTTGYDCNGKTLTIEKEKRKKTARRRPPEGGRRRPYEIRISDYCLNMSRLERRLPLVACHSRTSALIQ